MKSKIITMYFTDAMVIITDNFDISIISYALRRFSKMTFLQFSKYLVEHGRVIRINDVTIRLSFASIARHEYQIHADDADAYALLDVPPYVKIADLLDEIHANKVRSKLIHSPIERKQFFSKYSLRYLFLGGGSDV